MSHWSIPPSHPCRPPCSALGPRVGTIAGHRETGFMGLCERTRPEASSEVMEEGRDELKAGACVDKR